MGYLYEGDIDAAALLTKNVFKCTTKAFAIGVKMRGRGIEYALKPLRVTDGSLHLSEVSKNINKLKFQWHLKPQYSSWCKYNKCNKDKVKTQYGQMNFFSRFQWYQDDEYLSNLVISSVTLRDTRIKYSAKDGLKKSGIPVVITSADESSVGINNIGFVPLRDFISTRIGLLSLDNALNPILPPEGKRKKIHLFSAKSKCYLSNINHEDINEIVLIELDRRRQNLKFGTDSQRCDNI
jgi:hypothetical protein